MIVSEIQGHKKPKNSRFRSYPSCCRFSDGCCGPTGHPIALKFGTPTNFDILYKTRWMKIRSVTGQHKPWTSPHGMALYKVCLIAERVIRSLLCSGGLVTNFPEVARLHSLAKVQDEGLISSLTCSEHAISVVREVLTRYVRIRSHHEAVLKTDAKSLIRSKMNRLPIFSNL